MKEISNQFIVDAELMSTGIHDKIFQKYVDPTALQLSIDTIQSLNEWLERYQNEHYKGFNDADVIEKLDEEGLAIAQQIRNEHPEYKVYYFSAGFTKEIFLLPNGQYITLGEGRST